MRKFIFIFSIIACSWGVYMPLLAYDVLTGSMPSGCSGYLTNGASTSINNYVGSYDYCLTSGTHYYYAYTYSVNIISCSACSNGDAKLRAGMELSGGCNFLLGTCGESFAQNPPICAAPYVTSLPSNTNPSANSMVHEGSNCSNYSWWVFTKYGSGNTTYSVGNCTSCPSGYKLVATGTSFEVTSGCAVPFYTCEKTSCTSDSSCTDSSKPYCNTATGNCVACTTDSHCGTTTAWTNYPVNQSIKQRRRVYSCTNNTCSNSYEYRCSANYYGNGTTCTACPSPGTSSAGTTSVSGCCIATNTTGSDSIGSYKYKTGCCYQ